MASPSIGIALHDADLSPGPRDDGDLEDVSLMACIAVVRYDLRGL